MANRIQADYDQLATSANEFVQQSDSTESLVEQVGRLIQELVNGAWVGEGANRFFAEMDDLVMPGANRLTTTLRDASSATRRIIEALRTAEEEAAALFRGASGVMESSPRPGVPTTPPGPTEAIAGFLLPDDFFDNRRTRYNVFRDGQVANFRFESGVANAAKYRMVFGGKVVEVYAAVNPDPAKGFFHTAEQIGNALAAVPPELRDHVRTIYLEPNLSPNDAVYRLRNNDPNFRTYMESGADGIIRVYPSARAAPQGYLDGTLIHESAHVVSKRVWGTDPSRSRGWQEWQNVKNMDGNSVSVYGDTEIQEDFCEAVVNLIAYKGTAYELQTRQLWGNRFRAIENLLRI